MVRSAVFWGWLFCMTLYSRVLHLASSTTARVGLIREFWSHVCTSIFPASFTAASSFCWTRLLFSSSNLAWCLT